MSAGSSLRWPRAFLLVLLAIALGAILPRPASAHEWRQPVASGDPEAIGFELVAEGIDPTGGWFQRFEMTIKPGGTLADASELMYGTSAHVPELFDVIKRQFPDLRNPAQVPANLRVDLTVDPRIAFVPLSVSSDPESGATLYSYYNGARRALYDPSKASGHKGLSEIVDLPDDKPAKTFVVLEDFVPREVPAGVRIAHYDFRPADNLKSVVKQIYGIDSAKAITDFLSRTQWDPNNWPPRQLEQHQRLQIPKGIDISDPPFESLDVASGNPANGEALTQQLRSRQQAGIYPVRRQPYGTVYRVFANDFALTARQVAMLLYGRDEEYLAIAALAGFGTLHDLAENPPRDVRLFGRAFDLLVDYEKEQFVARRDEDPGDGKVTILLLNGTLIEQWQLDPGGNGLSTRINLPSGYRKLLYRPPGASVLAGQILHSFLSIGRREDSPQVRAQQEGLFVARFVWDWYRSVPKQPGDILEYGELVTVPTERGEPDQLIVLAVRGDPKAALDPSLAFYRPWLDNPFALALLATTIALLLLGTVSWVARRV